MCDTMGIILPEGTALFAKNSDRSPNEPQVIEWYEAKTHTGQTLKATYIEIGQVMETHALLLSRPVWLWGGEMGVNDCGVCIGNEAVFTKGAYGKTGLTGMDLLRLGLERGDSAQSALTVIIGLLERYGQGGNCGYDHNFYYDNSFLIMDRQAVYILETAGREWVYRKTERGSISNRLSIGTEGAAYSSGEPYDFKRKHMEPLYSHFSGSKQRREQTSCCIESASSVADVIRGLRTHAPQPANPLAKSSVGSTCMHAGGLVGDHTTSSMIVELGGIPKLWLTGCSTPCISLFKPCALGNEPFAPVYPAGDSAAEAYWLNRERFHRSVIGKTLPAEYYQERDTLEAGWLKTAEAADAAAMLELSKAAAQTEAAFYTKWEQRIPEEIGGSLRFHNYWEKKNAGMRKV